MENTEEANKEIRKKIESILFASGKKIDISEIAKLCRMGHNIELVEDILNKLKEKYNKDESPLLLNNEGTEWKLIVREKYISVVQNIVKQSELSKTIMETLAVIAYKSPVLQSEIIKIRTNKAYDHLRELENSGYISREKKGRTKLIKLTPKFFEYFDIPPDKLKERFRTVEELEKVVEQKESEAKIAKSEHKDMKEESKKSEDELKEETEKEIERISKVIEDKEKEIPEVDLVDEEGEKEKLETYNSEIMENTDLEEPKSNIEVIRDEVGNLKVVDLGLPPAEKKRLIKEAAQLRKEAEATEAKKLAGESEEEESEKKEKDFEKKFDLTGGEDSSESSVSSSDEESGSEESDEEQPEKEESEEKKGEGEKESADEDELGEKEESEDESDEKEESTDELEEEKPEERISESRLKQEAAESAKTNPIQKKEGKRLFEKGMSKDIQDRVDSRVEEIVFGKKKEIPQEEKEESSELTQEEEEQAMNNDSYESSASSSEEPDEETEETSEEPNEFEDNEDETSEKQ